MSKTSSPTKKSKHRALLESSKQNRIFANDSKTTFVGGDVLDAPLFKFMSIKESEPQSGSLMFVKLLIFILFKTSNSYDGINREREKDCATVGFESCAFADGFHNFLLIFA